MSEFKGNVKLSAIVALSTNGCIGIGTSLPFDIPMDLQFFKSVTLGSPVLAGRTTRTTLPKRGLPGRPTLTLTRTPTSPLEFSTVEDAVAWCARNGHPQLFLIGGRSVYSLGLPYCKYMYMTVVKKFIQGDILFPDYDPENWRVIQAQDHIIDCKSDTPRSVYVLKNARPVILPPCI